MKKILSILTLAAGTLFSVGSQAGPVISDGLAASAYSQSTSWNGNTAQSAFNGGTWNSGAHAEAWLQVDLGAVQDLTGLSFVVNRSPAVGVSSFRVYISDTLAGLTLPSIDYSNTVSHGQELSFNLATAGRYVKVSAIAGGSWVAMDKVNVFGVAPAQVPEPATYALVALALGAAGLARRKQTRV